MFQIAGKITNNFGPQPKKGGSGLALLVGAAVVLIGLIFLARALLALVAPAAAAFSGMATLVMWAVIGLVVVALSVGVPWWAHTRLREARANREAMAGWQNYSNHMMGLPPAPVRQALPARPVFAVTSRGEARREEIER